MFVRRSFRRALLQGAVYGLMAGLSVALSRVGDGFALLWLANGVLLPWLLIHPPRQWPATLVCVGLAAGAVSGTIGMGWRVAPLFALAAVIEAVAAAYPMRAAYRRFRSYTSLRAVLAMYGTGVVLAPLASSLPAALALHLVTGRPILTGIGEWAMAHGLGFLGAFPCAGLLAQARARHRSVLPTRESRRTAALSLAAVFAAGALCFGQARVPLLFLPILVTMYTMVLTDLFVSVVGLTMLLAMGLASAVLGFGPLGLLASAPAERYYFLQFYTACVSLAAMPVALLLERRRKTFAALSESETRYRLLADFSTDIIMVTGLRGEIRYVSPSIRQLGDWEPARLIGKTTDALIVASHRAEVAAAHRQVIARPDATASVEFLGVTRASGLRWFESHSRAIRRDGGGVEGVCSIVRDISHRKRREAELKAVALTDPLTSLANRRAFDMFMKTAQDGYVAIFDLDHFKRINDNHGHETGDRVIQAFARAARRVVRESDLVARIGGEEFAVHLPDASLPHARLVCGRICAALTEEARRAAPEVGEVTVSVGMSPLDAPLAEVLRRADAALYDAKARGRNRLAVAA